MIECDEGRYHIHWNRFSDPWRSHMTITIDLQPEIERGLAAQAQARGVSLADYVQEIVSREARVSEATPAPLEAKNLFDLFDPVRGLLSDEEIDTLFARNRSLSRPVDLA
jgi:hypothetical protein